MQASERAVRSPDLPYWMVGADGQRAAVRLEHDASALVRAVDGEPRTGMECRQRVGSRMAVVVVRADRDHGDARPEHLQLLREARIRRAMVSDLEHLDGAQ